MNRSDKSLVPLVLSHSKKYSSVSVSEMNVVPLIKNSRLGLVTASHKRTKIPSPSCCQTDSIDTELSGM